MSHWAEIDMDTRTEYGYPVLRVLVGDNNDPNGDEGYQWLIDNLGGTWIKTSYNGRIRGRYAGPGYTYDDVRDVFIAPSPYPSWVFNNETTDWDPPIPYPTDGSTYEWNDVALSWVMFDPKEAEMNAVWDNNKLAWIKKPDSGSWVWDVDNSRWIEPQD